MAGDLEFNADDIERLVRNIKTHGNRKALEKELRGGLNRASKDIRSQLVKVIPAALPSRGGLANTIGEATRSRTSVKGGKWAGVSMVFSARGHDIRVVTGKRLRHPVFERKNNLGDETAKIRRLIGRGGSGAPWVEQTAGVKPELWDAEIDQQTPDIRRAIVAVLNNVTRKMGSGL